MAKKQAAKIGHDPLGWMKGNDEPGGNDTPSPVKSSTDSGSDPDEASNPLGLKIDLLETSFNALAPKGEKLVARFYEELFKRHPEVVPMFANTTQAKQQKKLLSALVLVVNNLRKPDVLAKALTEMGKRHQHYGAVEAHYGVVAGVLLDVMAEIAGDLWTNELYGAWKQALETVAKVMLDGYTNEESNKMAASPETMTAAFSAEPEGIVDDLNILMNILEFAPINIMMADADENIIFVNKKARDILTSIEGELAKYLPGFRVSEVVGGSIHRYHKDPAAIKNLLQSLRPGDKRQGKITPGHFVFEHETRVLVNSKGVRMGYVVQWNDVTEQRKNEEQAFRLQKAVDGAQTAMMMIDRDLVITYANEETIKLLRRYEDILRSLYPAFSVDKAIGSCIDMFHKNPAHQRRLLDDPRNLPYETDIQVGPLTFHIRASAILDLSGKYIGNTLEWDDVTETRKKEIEVARLQSAIQGAQTNIMMCDTDLTITYVNPAVQAMMAKRESALRSVFPGFDSKNLIGQCIDKFHRNPAHQRSLLADMNRLPASAEMRLADVEFRVNATAIVGPKGEWMGNMVEWVDITEQKDAERQIESMIDAAVTGDLSTRIDTSNYEGFLKGLGDGINEMLDAMAGPMGESIDVMKELAKGGLTKSMTGEYQGEFKSLADAVNTSISNLFEMVTKIRQASGAIATGAGEISEGNTNLSQRTEEQASSLEETASSMEEITSTVKQNADNARQANQLANAARQTAEQGGDVVGKAVKAMSEINASSRKIADIIGVIDEIAFQTNLLALNAAVEAARAGEQGRGFAVVAAEVRNLAQRSATAAKEIKDLISDSVEKVKEGSSLVDKSGSTLNEIMAGVKKVSDIISEIAAASQEQSSGIEQVNKAVMQMDEMTQQNAALVEQAAAASKSMDDQARGMSELMEYFDLGQGSAPVTQSRRSAPPVNRSPSSSRSAPATSRKSTSSDSEWEEF